MIHYPGAICPLEFRLDRSPRPIGLNVPKKGGEDQNDRFGWDEKGGKRSDKWNGKGKVASGKEEGDDELASPHAKTSEKYEDIGRRSAQ